MRSIKKLLAVGIIVGLFIVLLNVSFASEGNRPTRPGTTGTISRDPFNNSVRMNEIPAMAPSRRAGIGKTIARLKNQLELTDEQVTKLEQVEATDPNEIMKLYQVTREINLAINSAVMQADEAKIKELCVKLGKATEAQSLLRAKEYALIMKILTKEQYDKFIEFSDRGRPRARPTAAPARTRVDTRQRSGGGIRPPTPVD